MGQKAKHQIVWSKGFPLVWEKPKHQIFPIEHWTIKKFVLGVIDIVQPKVKTKMKKDLIWKFDNWKPTLIVGMDIYNKVLSSSCELERITLLGLRSQVVTVFMIKQLIRTASTGNNCLSLLNQIPVSKSQDRAVFYWLG